MRVKLLFFIITAAFVKGFAQPGIISSNTYIQTCIDKTQCSSINNSSYIFYDENSSNLYLKIDFARFKVGQDSIDDWLDDLTGSYFYYKARLPENFFNGLSNHAHKTEKLNGKIFFNGIWQNQSMEITVYSSENSIISSNTNGNSYDNFKVNFSLPIAPKDFKIHKKTHHLRKTIFIGVALGRINLLAPEATHLLGEAYNQ